MPWMRQREAGPSWPSHHQRLCCPPGSTGTMAASNAHPVGIPLPGATGYTCAPALRRGQLRRSPDRVGPPQFSPPPSMRSAPHTPGSPSRLRFQALHRFHGLRPDPREARHSLGRPETGRLSNDTAGFAPCYRPNRGSSIQGFRRWAPARPVSRPDRQPCSSSTSWQLSGPDFHRQATTSLRTRRNTCAYGIGSVKGR